jgi:predicted nucleotidyltransferase
MTSSNTSKSREELRETLIRHFSQQDEVYAIHLFGREADGRVDCYSDIDIIICSADLERTWRNYSSILQTISPVTGRLLLESTPTSFAEMILFQDASPYQKVDLSLCDRIETKEVFGPFIKVYEKNVSPSAITTTLPVFPRLRDIHLDLADTLFSVPRFTKCLFRRDYDMYRRWKGTTNSLMLLLYEKYFGWQRESIRRDLKPHEAKHLYYALSRQDAEQLETVLPLTGNFNLAVSYRNAIKYYIDLMEQKSLALAEPINDALVHIIHNFLNAEIERYLKLHA